MSQEHAILWASLIIRDNMLPTCIQPSRHSNILDADFLILNASVTYEKNLLIWIYHIHLNCPNFFFYNISQTDFLRQLLKTFKDRQRRSLLLSIILIHKKKPIPLHYLTSCTQTIYYCHNLQGQRQGKSPPALLNIPGSVSTESGVRKPVFR